jgi:hypothetical protein
VVLVSLRKAAPKGRERNVLLWSRGMVAVVAGRGESGRGAIYLAAKAA